MERIRKERTYLRGAFTKTLKSFEEIEGSSESGRMNQAFQWFRTKAEELFRNDELFREHLFELEESIVHKELEAMDEYKKRFVEATARYDDVRAVNNDAMSSVSQSTLQSQRMKRNFKMPTIDMKRFDGDLKNWISFWGQFKKIDEDPEIDGDDKFQFLLQFTSGRAKDLVESFPPFGLNYKKAVDALKNRFARKEMLIETYIRELLQLVLGQAKGHILDIRSLYDKIATYLNCLETLGIKKDKYESMLLPLVESALPEDLLVAYNRSYMHSDLNGTDSVQLERLLNFVKREVDAREKIKLTRSDLAVAGSSCNINEEEDIPTAACMATQVVKKSETVKDEGKVKFGEKGKDVCLFCDKDNHSMFNCAKVNTMSVDERRSVIKKKGICFICFRKGHLANVCKAFLKCLFCSRRHHVFFCPNLQNGDDKEGTQNDGSVMTTFQSKQHTTLLQTLIVEVQGINKSMKVRALLDSGSQRTYVSGRIVKELELEVVGEDKLNHCLFGGLQKATELHRRVRFRVCSLNKNFSTEMIGLEQQGKLCGNLPKMDRGLTAKLYELNIIVSDTKYDIEEIELLIGSDYLAQILTTSSPVQLGANLVAVETLLGWTVQGPIRTTSATVAQSLISCFVQIEDLWNLEALGITDPHGTKDNFDLASFNESISTEEGGRYEVPLLWKEGCPQLGTNHKLAYRRLQATTKKLKTAELLEAYDEQFMGWMKEGIIERVENDDSESGHYLAHHGVVKLTSATTKLRPVFDASAKDANDLSLNECLDKGLNIIELIPKLLIKFRKGAFGVVSDIRKAFLQIGLKKEDRDYLKFLWWENIGECKDVLTYRHKRVVFGVSCSPFLLAATINYHLDRCPEKFNETARTLKDSFYVDNCVTSFETEAKLLKFIEEAKETMALGKFELTQWVTAPKRVNDTKTVAVLGLNWDTLTDTLRCKLDLKGEFIDRITKRKLLSVAQMIFDLLGFLCPATLIPKLIIQRAWACNKCWDEPIPDELEKDFRVWFKTVKFIKECKVPRCVSNKPIEQCEASIHLFCDASKDAYAGCIFLRTQTMDHVHVQLIIAKSRVTPVKKDISLPRLELMGALIASRLYVQVQESGLLTHCKEYKVFCWTDSSVVLAWIQRKTQWKVFVSNRVREICRNTSQKDWYHLPGEYNPADIPSRGCDFKTVARSQWWKGPQWLYFNENQWPRSNVQCNIDESIIEKEEKKFSSINVDVESSRFSDSLTFFASYKRIIRLVAWILRLSPRVRAQYMRGSGNNDLSISNEEFENAENTVFRLIQGESVVPDNLAVDEDEKGLKRVRTRLSLGHEDRDFVNPILLPGQHPIIERLVVQRHERMHVGINWLMSDLRNTFWIVGARRLVKKVVTQCIKCKRFTAKHYEVPEPPLPTDRIERQSVFEATGIDLAGPLFLKHKEKCWIVLFTCATYRAVHLELVDNLSTADFMLALRRFIARRGRVSIIYSDNGTNFQGAANLFRSIDWSKVESDTQPIKWKFIPPGAPWWGGWWERLIRVVKEILRRMLGKTTLNKNELYTLLCDCEAVVNSRPLTYVANDTDSLRPLTPAMFLHCIGNSEVPDLDHIDSTNCNIRFKYLKKLRSDIRQRFRNEYLALLVSREGSLIKEPQVGDIVLIQSDQKRLFWALGLIKQIYVGVDGHARVAKLQTATGDKVRAYQRLFPLELSAISTRLLHQPDIENESSSVAESIPLTSITTRVGRVVRVPNRLDL